LHSWVTRSRAALALAAAVVVGLLALSGDSRTDPRTPAGLPGLPPPFLGTAVVGDGWLTAAVDAYGEVVDLRADPSGRALIDNPAERQATETVDVGAGIVPRLRIGDGPALPLWRADSVEQRYLAGTNVVRTAARFGAVEATVTVAVTGDELALAIRTGDAEAVASVGVAVDDEVRCRRERKPGQLDLLCRVGRAVPVSSGAAAGSAAVIGAATMGDRAWLARAWTLGAGAPAWAVAMYERSLLTLRALTDARTGAAAAGARDGWAYVWPRDAGTAALAFAAAGYRAEAKRVASFLLGLDLDTAARFHGDGTPVAGRGPQGDAAGWVSVAARAASLPPPSLPHPWRERPDYQEGEPGDYLGNAIASNAPWVVQAIRRTTHGAEEDRGFVTPRGLVRRAGDPGSGLDSAAAWAVRPFPQPALYPRVRRKLLHLVAGRTRFGITPGEGWGGGVDPWTAPTAWTAWGLAALGERRDALRLLADLRRAATPAGALPERVDARSGVPRSTPPLAWSHAFAILALRQLWPTDP
jgi:hypothetical protein